LSRGPWTRRTARRSGSGGGRGGSLIVEERLSGELAYAIYEEQTHRHRISVATSLFPALAEALGCQAGEVPERVALLLGQEDAYLASLMDLLDGLGMPYSYVASAGEGVVSYRPELPS
jgi:hypothetical protein